MLDPRWSLLPAALSAIAACSSGRAGGPAGAGGAASAASAASAGGVVVGFAEEALAPGFWIGDVQVDPASFPLEDPGDLLMSAEGAGPRTLDVTVSTSVAPQISFTGTHTPSHADISKALGYDVTQIFQLTADSSVLVPIDAYARISAYPTFQRATWTIFGLGTVPMGAGTTYKPIGVYFETCGCIGPDPCGAACVSGVPLGGLAGIAGTGDPPASDAGAGDGG